MNYAQNPETAKLAPPSKALPITRQISLNSGKPRPTSKTGFVLRESNASPTEILHALTAEHRPSTPEEHALL